jgi:hypothetical protein
MFGHEFDSRRLHEASAESECVGTCSSLFFYHIVHIGHIVVVVSPMVEGLEFRKHSLSLSLNALAAWVEGLGLRTTRFALFASSWRTLRAKKIIIQRSASRIE